MKITREDAKIMFKQRSRSQTDMQNAKAYISYAIDTLNNVIATPERTEKEFQEASIAIRVLSAIQLTNEI